MDEIVSALKETYHGGFGMKTDSHNLSVWYGEDGIRLAKGNSAQYASRAQLISWEDAAKRIGELWMRANMRPMWNWQKLPDMSGPVWQNLLVSRP